MVGHICLFAASVKDGAFYLVLAYLSVSKITQVVVDEL